MQVNIQKLKGKMAENDMNVERLASEIGVNRTTFYRKLNGGGGKFTVSELQSMVSALKMTARRGYEYFFGSIVA